MANNFIEIFDNTRSIAVIGMKDAVSETAYKIPYYMYRNGYKIYPVNPLKLGIKVLGHHFYEKVTDTRDKIDLVNIFRRPEFIPAHVKEILKMKPLPQYVWFQLGIYNDDAAEELEKHGIKVVQSRCIMVEHAQYS